MTVRELYHKGTEQLKEVGIQEAEIDAWILLEFVTGISRASFYANPQALIEDAKAEVFLKGIQKRKTHIPLQHITGEQEFMGLTFRVNEHVLIPRQDTETLVECAQGWLRPGIRILDMCTGSGCILISLLMQGHTKGIKAENSLGVDVSKEALLVARENAKKYELSVPMIESDLFEAVEETFDLIVSNPPYIKTAAIQELAVEVQEYDPYLALDGKEDGLYFYRKIICQSSSYLNFGGHLCFEIGYDQAAEVVALMEKEGFENVTVKKDLTGLDRVVWGVYNKAEKKEKETCLIN